MPLSCFLSAQCQRPQSRRARRRRIVLSCSLQLQFFGPSWVLAPLPSPTAGRATEHGYNFRVSRVINGRSPDPDKSSVQRPPRPGSRGFLSGPPGGIYTGKGVRRAAPAGRHASGLKSGCGEAALAVFSTVLVLLSFVNVLAFNLSCPEPETAVATLSAFLFLSSGPLDDTTSRSPLTGSTSKHAQKRTALASPRGLEKLIKIFF